MTSQNPVRPVCLPLLTPSLRRSAASARRARAPAHRLRLQIRRKLVIVGDGTSSPSFLLAPCVRSSRSCFFLSFLSFMIFAVHCVLSLLRVGVGMSVRPCVIVRTNTTRIHPRMDTNTNTHTRALDGRRPCLLLARPSENAIAPPPSRPVTTIAIAAHCTLRFPLPLLCSLRSLRSLALYLVRFALLSPTLTHTPALRFHTLTLAAYSLRFVRSLRTLASYARHPVSPFPHPNRFAYLVCLIPRSPASCLIPHFVPSSSLLLLACCCCLPRHFPPPSVTASVLDYTPPPSSTSTLALTSDARYLWLSSTTLRPQCWSAARRAFTSRSSSVRLRRPRLGLRPHYGPRPAPRVLDSALDLHAPRPLCLSALPCRHAPIGWLYFGHALGRRTTHDVFGLRYAYNMSTQTMFVCLLGSGLYASSIRRCSVLGSSLLLIRPRFLVPSGTRPIQLATPILSLRLFHPPIPPHTLPLIFSSTLR